MDDLVTFLRARLDEDERAARAVGFERIETGEYMWNSKYLLLQGGQGGESKATSEFDADLAEHIARHDPARVLREVDAKRRIVRAYEDAVAEFGDSGPAMASYDRLTGSVSSRRNTLELLALPYADHPDYRDDWRP